MLEQLKRSMSRIEFADGWWAKRKKKAEMSDALKSIEERFSFHHDYYDLFHLELKMQDVNPLVYVGKLFLGIICVVVSIIIWVQM